MIPCGAVYGLDFVRAASRISRTVSSAHRLQAPEGLGEGLSTSFTSIQNGTLWAATDGGLSRVKNGRVTHAYQQERTAVRRGSLDDGRRRPFGLAVYDLRPRAHCPARVGRRGRRSKPDHRDRGFRQLPTESGAIPSRRLQPRLSPSPRMARLWFLPLGGVSVIDPRHLPFNTLPPPVHIEQVTADRKTYWCNCPATHRR